MIPVIFFPEIFIDIDISNNIYVKYIYFIFINTNNLNLASNV